MDIIGSLVDSRVRIYPLEYFITFLEDLPNEKDIHSNILKCIGRGETGKRDDTIKLDESLLNDEDIIIMRKVNKLMKGKTSLQEIDVEEDNFDHHGKEKLADTKLSNGTGATTTEKDLADTKNNKEQEDFISVYASKCGFDCRYWTDHISSTPEKPTAECSIEKDIDKKNMKEKKYSSFFLTVSDIDWLHYYLQKRKSWGDDVPYLHTLLDKANIVMPENQVTKRLPDDLEARCIELRARRDREFSTMTLNITVESVKMEFIDERIFERKSVQPVGLPKFAAMLKQIHLLSSKGVKEKEHQD